MPPNRPDPAKRFLPVLVILFLIGPMVSTAQMMNLQFGASISHLKSNIGGSPYTFLGRNRVDFSGFAGFEYLEHKYWSISSNVGFVRKGGKEAWVDRDTSEGFNYLSVNTTFNVKYPVGERWVPYLSVGPRIDFLLNDDHAFPYFDYPGFLHKESYGMVAAVGLRYTFPTFVLGVRAEHLFNFNYLASDGLEFNYTETSIISLTMGSRFGGYKKAAAQKVR